MKPKPFASLNHLTVPFAMMRPTFIRRYFAITYKRSRM
jgi:hypothetical protein